MQAIENERRVNAPPVRERAQRRAIESIALFRNRLLARA